MQAWDKDRATLEGVRTKLKDPLARGIDTQVLEAAKAKAYTEKFLYGDANLRDLQNSKLTWH